MERVLQDGTRATLAAERDARLRRAWSLTRWLAGGAVLLVGLFAGLVAQAHPGHHRPRAGPTSSTPATAPTPATPPTPEAGGGPALAAPDQAPAPTQAPPVAQSGGS